MLEWKLFPKIKAIPLGNIQFLSLGTKKRKKTSVAIMGVHTASATADKQKWWILNPKLSIFSMSVHVFALSVVS